MSDLEAVATTQRLRLRPQTIEDAPFVLALMTDPDWIRYIGDRGVYDLEGARRYIENGAVTQQREHGFSLYLVERRPDSEPVGLCGLIKRDGLEAPDLGFAFLPEHRGLGLARESATAVLEVAQAMSFERVLAIVSPDNGPSRALLEGLGFEEERIAEQDGNPVLVLGLEVGARPRGTSTG